MARPRSADKRNAILDAATRVFAERGLSAAPTSEISRRAGVAEGTLFTYFKTKDDLVNALYREIKLELADAMMSDFPRKKGVRTRLRHVWDRYVNWGIANPKQRKVLAQLTVSEVLTKESTDAGSAPFVEFQAMIRDAIEQRIFQNDLPGGTHLEVVNSFGGGHHRPYGVESVESQKLPGQRLSNVLVRRNQVTTHRIL